VTRVPTIGPYYLNFIEPSVHQFFDGLYQVTEGLIIEWQSPALPSRFVYGIHISQNLGDLDPQTMCFVGTTIDSEYRRSRLEDPFNY
jgi:hypothetical protein